MPATIVIGFNGTESGEDEGAEVVVVVGSSDRGPLGRTFPGSTGDRLLQGSARPVAVAPRGLRESPPERLARIAVAYLDTPVVGRDADLLVCGSRAYGPLRRVLLGGVSSRLPRRSALPLLVVPRSGDDHGSRTGG